MAQTFAGYRPGIEQALVILFSSLPLAGSHGLGDQALEGKLLLLEVLGGGVLNLELGHSVAEGRLDLLLVAALELQGHGGVGDNLLNTGDVRLELLAGLETLGEIIIAGLELGSICTAKVSMLTIYET